MAQFDEYGREIPDTRPVAVPHGWERPLSLTDQIRRMVRGELSRQAAEDGDETFEEADDFDVDEDPEPFSAYEVPEAAPEVLGGVRDVDADPPPSPVPKAPVASPSVPEVPSKG